MNIVSTVQLEAMARPDDTTSRSAFRVVQELLTNARRHAPGIGARGAIRATSEIGVEIVVGNYLAAHVPLQFRPESGLEGMMALI